MSRYIKALVAGELRRKLDGANDVVFVDVIGVDALKTWKLRQAFRNKGINLLVVKASLAQLALKGTALGDAFAAVSGSICVAWGADDFVSLCKEITAAAADTNFEPLKTKGGVMDGELLTAVGVAEVSKWPNRTDQLSIISGQVCSPGAMLSGQLVGIGSVLCGQIESKGESSSE